MGKIPGISHQEAIRAFRKAGFEITRQSGHVVMFDGRRTIVIPRSKQINAVTMFAIVKDAGLTAGQFQDLL